MIRFENVSFGYRPRQSVVDDLSLEIRPGDRICLTGPSGCGKTTVLRLLMGLEKPRRGQITGTEGLRFSAVFQEDRLIPGRTVLENAVLFAEESAARAVLERLGLGEMLNSLPGELSGGQRRRAALGRALAHRFDVLVLDEALTGLDPAATEQCLALIHETVGDKPLVMVTHDGAHARRLGARPVEWKP